MDQVLNSFFRNFLQNFDSQNFSFCSSEHVVQKGEELSYFKYLFIFLCDSWWRRSLASRWIFLGPYFYLPYDELISSHGRKGRTNNDTNRWNSESCPFIIQNYCVSRKSWQTVTVCKWLGNMTVCHQKQMKSRIWLKDQISAQAKPFQNKDTMSASW